MARGCSIACLVRSSHLLLPIHSPNLPHHLMISISNLRPTPASASTRVSVSNPSLWRVWRRQHGESPRTLNGAPVRATDGNLDHRQSPVIERPPPPLYTRHVCPTPLTLELSACSWPSSPYIISPMSIAALELKLRGAVHAPDIFHVKAADHILIFLQLVLDIYLYLLMLAATRGIAGGG
ncbi:hypothetical protein BD626DRAFT_274610 [Schizophyllum amplum]|uniref:Uncharacterized protein n=1 Tax=Schizophyllum amplum TaxID=97359 RepID=A0A550CFQ9_9AGAR|nr:hypothetical protein BD626DRAFT_274610 [Auriculariopsis ampla]